MTTCSRTVASALLLVALGATTHPAAADRDIVFETKGERSTNTKILLAAFAGAGVLAGGLGVYWNLDSKSAADDISASKFTGRAWSAEDIALADQADRSKTRAAVAYGVGGALLLGAAIMFIVTDPPSETVRITPNRATPTVAPAPGGAVIGGTWSF